MCQQLVMARVGQAEAMKASQHAKQQLRAAQPNPQGSLHEFASIQKRLTTAELELRQVRSQLAMSTKELSQSGMQNFELSQTLQDARTQLAAHLEANGKLQARAKKYRESHSSLCKQVEAAKAESAAFSQQLAQSAASSQQLTDSADTLQQELQHTQEQLKERTAELSQAHEAQAALQQQARQAQADKQQVGKVKACIPHHCLYRYLKQGNPIRAFGLGHECSTNTVQRR